MTQAFDYAIDPEQEVAFLGERTPAAFLRELHTAPNAMCEAWMRAPEFAKLRRIGCDRRAKIWLCKTLQQTGRDCCCQSAVRQLN